MIGTLRGIVLDRDLTGSGAGPEAVVEAGGVGYRVALTSEAMSTTRVDTEAFVYIHHHFGRDGDQRLFGFASKDERKAFVGLLAAPGVGPSTAMAIISTFGSRRLSQILAEDDITALCQVPKVGKKTAQRLLVELKSTLVLDPAPSSTSTGQDDMSGPVGPPSMHDDIGEALTQLGYSGDEVKRGLAALPENETGEDDAGRWLKIALRAVGGD